MKLLITGAGGQLGKEWVQFCELNRIKFQAFSSAELDVTSERTLIKLVEEVNPTALINCAAYTKVDKAEDEPEKAELVNSIALDGLINVCKKLDIKLVHYSTDYVFSGSEEDHVNVPEGYPEDYPTAPINIYGETKRNGEQKIVESGCDYLLIRVSWLCGQFGNNFVKTMLRLGEDRDRLTVVNDQFGSPTFSDQVVGQTFELIRQGKSGIFHLSSKGITTWFEFAQEIFKHRKLKINVEPVSSSQFKTKAARPHFSKLSTRKISTIEGIKILSWQEGLKKLLNSL